MNAPLSRMVALPPAKPTLLQLAGKAWEAEKLAARAALTGEEYAAEETVAMNTKARFWAALEAETGLTADMVSGLR